MKSDINDLCEAFLAALTNAGYAVKSIENYKQVSNRFKKFCAENGYDKFFTSSGINLCPGSRIAFPTTLCHCVDAGYAQDKNRRKQT